MNLVGVPLALMPRFLPVAREMAAGPRPKVSYAQQTQGRVVDMSLVGFLDPDYLTAKRFALAKYAADPTIQAVCLYIDSPGGTTAGTLELAEVVRRCVETKPVHVVAGSVLASAAYWIASQATSITLAPSCDCGSIGSFIYVIDSSEWFRREGLRAVVVRTGEHKAVGVPGLEISEANIEWIQSLVEEDLSGFQTAIVKGRGLDPKRVIELSTGASWPARTAVAWKLADAIALPEDRRAEIHAQYAERYVDLSGQTALDQLDKLAQEYGAKAFCSASVRLRDRLTAEFPTLVAAATAHRKKLNRVPVSYHVPRGP